MKVVIIGGTGLIGRNIAPVIEREGHEVVIASPSRGVNAVTGEGLANAFKGADIVIDVSDLQDKFTEGAAHEFYEKSSNNIVAEAKKAGVKHLLPLSILGMDKLVGNCYFDAKNLQEKIVRESGIPYTIVRAAQFFEFLSHIADYFTVDNVVTATTKMVQPIAAKDVGEVIAKLAIDKNNNKNIVNVGGPHAYPLSDIISKVLSKMNDPRKVVGDPNGTYMGAPIDDSTLTIGPNDIKCSTDFDTWFQNTK